MIEPSRQTKNQFPRLYIFNVSLLSPLSFLLLFHLFLGNSRSSCSQTPRCQSFAIKRLIGNSVLQSMFVIPLTFPFLFYFLFLFFFFFWERRCSVSDPIAISFLVKTHLEAFPAMKRVWCTQCNRRRQSMRQPVPVAKSHV